MEQLYVLTEVTYLLFALKNLSSYCVSLPYDLVLGGLLLRVHSVLCANNTLLQ